MGVTHIQSMIGHVMNSYISLHIDMAYFVMWDCNIKCYVINVNIFEVAFSYYGFVLYFMLYARYMYEYTHIYIYRERERDRKIDRYIDR